MKILFYGAGPRGSMYAVRLQESGHEVSILARGQRLAENEEIAFNAGLHTELIHMAHTDFERLVKPKMVELSLAV